ncbi:MAG: fatty acid oxidation complex subunit alpha FadJ [Gemmatimonadaceae bacterium]|nr:fatty acid oxidation complex subunit alpha FadJ [Gemmatimonadaceae bacterium]
MPPALQVVHENGIAVITFDLPGEPVNKFSRAVKDEFMALLDRLEADPRVQAAVILSGKPDSFIAGADIEEFVQWTTGAQASAASSEGHAMLARLERGRLPVVAAIHGACLGGGLEMALACAWRVATDHPKTVLALPEVQLGLVPGAGGTQRLPRTIGLQAALDMILTGKNVRAKKAAQLGLVHDLVHPAILRTIAVQRAGELAAGQRRRNASARSRSARSLLLDDNPIGRSIVLRRAREVTMKKTRGLYPAPLAAIDAVAAGYQGRERGFAEEARLFGEMAETPASRELIFLFFATTALRKDNGVRAPDGASAVAVAHDVNALGVLGAGFMGSGIAAVAAQAGIPVRLKDAGLERVGKGLAAVRDVLQERLVKRHITRQQFDDQMLLVGGTIDYTGFGGTDLIIEAVFEDLDTKHKVVREVEAIVPAHAIIASNTSTLPIGRIAEASVRPERVIGMHFFSPVHKMPLLEVIITPQTAPGVIASTVAFGRTLGKTVIVVHDSPGFYVNRILSPYINEAGRLLDIGARIEAIDEAMLAFGFPVGPITLLDEVGLDIAGKSGAIFHAAFGDRLAPSQSLRAVIEAGRLGRKGKSGFYHYDEAGAKGDVDTTVYALLPTGAQRHEVPIADIQRQLSLVMVNEAARCLEEGIIRSPRDGDVGAVFGIGFPPMRGGPFRYIDTIGPASIVQHLEDLEFRYPGRFLPCELLVQMARKGERFYRGHGPDSISREWVVGPRG